MITYLVPWILVVCMLAAISSVYWLLDRAERRLQSGKRSPFPKEFLRSRGHSLYEKIEEKRLDFLGWWMGVMLILPLLYAAFISQAYFANKQISHVNWLFYAVIGLIGLIYLGRKTIPCFREIRVLRLGYEGELGVGKELNQLMLYGFRVYHDFPAGKFNIDHIVIGPTGVFAVETKARSKPDTGKGKADATVVCEGNRLVFPGWTESEPLEQAKRQAAWLSHWLASAVGERVAVKAALVIPGWLVERKKIADVLAFNARESQKAIVDYSGARLNDSMIQRIAHQVEDKCRDVAPRSNVAAKQAKSKFLRG
ncbi:nuclease-related domain-containing protein [Thiosocius teredinicola]|uniref:nuclease-related domain-containing protein n=1 Tax=Thiosocius teredinicola TaxID=1973002 RepID=UPI000990B63B